MSTRTPAPSGGRVRKEAKRIARGVARRIRNLGTVDPEGFDLADVPTADVALYFPDAPAKLYQLQQWLPVFESRTDVKTLVILRHAGTYRELVDRTPLQVLLVPRYEILMSLYDRAGFSAVVYVNNGWTNFQSLSFQPAVHIHVNHGESDKISMVSNQAKAYDRVFVAGEAAVQRHRAALAWFDESHLVRVGRPQLDLPVPSPLPERTGPTVTYAPTWEGEDDANNYTSIDLFGPQIVAAALQVPDSRVVYKPHPRIPLSKRPEIITRHEQIVSMITSAAATDPGRGHVVLDSADVLGVIRATDLMITDVSSVGLDFLYLRPDKPLAIGDRRSDRQRLLADAPVSAASHVIDAGSVGALAADLTRLVAEDPYREDRARLRDFYFDGLAPGESTTRFFAELAAQIEAHDDAIQTLSRVRATDPARARTALQDDLVDDAVDPTEDEDQLVEQEDQ